VLRPEEVELAEMRRREVHLRGYGEVQEILFAGSVERLPCAWPGDGPVPVTRVGTMRPGPFSRFATLPEQRDSPSLPVAAFRRRAADTCTADAHVEFHRVAR